MIKIKVPVLPESISEASVVEWHKQPGDVVKINDVLGEIETDKVVLEIPSEVNGIMGEIVEPVGSVVTQQQLLAYVDEKDIAEIKPSEPKTSSHETKPAGPAARKAIADNNLTRQDIKGSGKDGRILKEDVMTQTSASVEVPSERFEERVPMSSLRKTVANRLLQSTQQTATLTTINELDMSQVMAIRNKYKDKFVETHGVKLGFMSFFVVAAIEALKKFPAVNAFIDGDDIVYHGFCDIGVAVSSDRGLVVPVLKNVHHMSLDQIESLIVKLANKAQAGKLTLDEITGGTFTITNGGIFGSMLSTPILNTPQSGILGMHNIVKRPVVVNDEIKIRPIMYLALSYDHRIVDGREAVLFLRHIKESLEDPSRILLKI